MRARLLPDTILTVSRSSITNPDKAEGLFGYSAAMWASFAPTLTQVLPFVSSGVKFRWTGPRTTQGLHASTHRDGRVDDLDVRFFNENLARLDAQPLDILFGDRLAAVELLDLPAKHAHGKTRTARHPREGRRRGRLPRSGRPGGCPAAPSVRPFSSPQAVDAGH